MECKLSRPPSIFEQISKQEKLKSYENGLKTSHVSKNIEWYLVQCSVPGNRIINVVQVIRILVVIIVYINSKNSDT